MFTYFFSSIRALVFFSILCGAAYPVFVTFVGQSLFSSQANGSLISGKNGQTLGSSLIAQKSEKAGYLHPRPSAGDFATIASGASNFSPTSPDFRKTVQDRAAALGGTIESIPPDLLMTSGSGLDPHISLEAALYQAARIAQARSLPEEEIRGQIIKYSMPVSFIFSHTSPRIVNVLEFNVSLDEATSQ